MLKPVARCLALLALASLAAGRAHAQAMNTVGVQFGLNSFLGNLGHSEIHGPVIKPSATDRTNYLNAVHDLGVRSIRETFLNWADIEPVRGAGYRLGPYDDLAKKASERGIEIIALAYPFPDWATGAKTKPGLPPVYRCRQVRGGPGSGTGTRRGPGHTKCLASSTTSAVDADGSQYFSSMAQLPLRRNEPEFREMVSTVVKRYSGIYPQSLRLQVPIRKWIFSNELDYPGFRIDPDEYAYWLRVFYETVKKADPHALVVTMGFTGASNDIAWINRFLDSPNLKGKDYPYFDVLDFHCYPIVFDPNIYVMDADVGFLQRALQKRGISRPLWLMETGDNSTNESEQASRAIEDLIHGASLPGVTRVSLQGLYDFGGKGGGWGVLGNSPSGEIPRRKPLFTAYQTFLGVMANNRRIEFLGPGRYRVTMIDGTIVYVLWADGPNRDARELFGSADTLQVRTLQNKVEKVRAGELALTSAPVFVTVTR